MRRPSGACVLRRTAADGGSLLHQLGLAGTRAGAARGRRRILGLRHEEVAVLAGISIEYDTKLERGTATGVSEGVIEGIKHALHLDEGERTHLLDLIHTASTTRPRSRPRARAGCDLQRPGTG